MHGGGVGVGRVVGRREHRGDGMRRHETEEGAEVRNDGGGGI